MKMCLTIRFRQILGVTLLVMLFVLSGCPPQLRSCLDYIFPPPLGNCTYVGQMLNVNCCWYGLIYLCDLAIYRDGRGVVGYRDTTITHCVGPLRRCRMIGPYTCR